MLKPKSYAYQNDTGVILKMTNGTEIFGYKSYEDERTVTLRSPVIINKKVGDIDYIDTDKYMTTKESKFYRIHIESETMAEQR